MDKPRIRVLMVPDSVHWVTGTIAKNIARFNPWIEATIASGPVIDQIFADQPQLINRFDLVHFTCPYASKQWLPLFSEMVPCVTSHHHVTDWNLIKHNLEGDAIVVGSPEWAEDLRTRGADMKKVFCVPYGVDACLFKPVADEERQQIRKEIGIGQNATVIGFFGKNSSNDDDRKGIDIFTEALRRLNRELAGLTVLLVGPGWQALKSELSSTGIHCICQPFVPELKDLTKMYQALDFYWITARVEGGPVTLLEAMSTEVCCLTTAVGIAREVVRDGENGLLLPFDDAEAFAQKTLVLADNRSERQRLGVNARVTILDTMHVGVTTRGIQAVYEKAFQNSHERLHKTFNINHAANEPPLGEPQPGDEVVPLSGFPSRFHRRVRMLETLAWSEHLVMYHRQRALAARLILTAWLRNPASLQPPRVFLRRFLPVSLVARVVKVKNHSRTRPLVAGYQPTTKA